MQRERGNLDLVSSALREVQLGARVWAQHDRSFAFEHDGQSLMEKDVWNLVCEYGRFDLSYEPAAMGGYEELLPNACKVIIEADGDRIEVLCADIRDIVRSKKTAGRPKDQESVSLLKQQMKQRNSR